MYHVLVSIHPTFVKLSMQSYDNFTKAVSLTYGKYADKTKTETFINQLVMKNTTSLPMEKCRRMTPHYGSTVKD